MAVTDVATSLPDVTLQPTHTVTVELDDALAVVTKLNVYALNVETGLVEDIAALPPLFSYVPTEVPE
jgi:hypothetical protein